MNKTLMALSVVGGVVVSGAATAETDMMTKAAQYVLRQTHDYRGSLDGDLGPKTRRALLDFQATNGLRTTGTLDAKTLAVLRLRQSRQAVGVGDSLRLAIKQGFEQVRLVPDWSSLENLQAFQFSYEDYGMPWSFVHVCGDARFPTSRYGAKRSIPFMMDLILEDNADTPPIAALLRGDYMVSDLWTGDYIFVKPFCQLRVGSAVALGLVR